MATDAAGLLDALDIDAAHVVGMSMGGMIAQSLAINHAHKVRSLTSVMSNTGDRKNGGVNKRVLMKLARAKPPTKETAAEDGTEMYSLWAGSSWDRAEHLATARRAVERSYRPAGVERQTAAIAASADRTPGLRNVTAPTLVVHGLEDKLVMPSGGVATANAVPGSRLLMFPDMGHDIPRTRHTEIADAILANTERGSVPVGV
ncbi:MAG: alpha/beta fold hydrolase [Acidimicrobiales bacterium]